jgi:hypothetical protein
MSKRILAAFAVWCAACAAPPPVCTARESEAVVTTQDELDALAGCATLFGLHIRTPDVVDLAPLGYLTNVEGTLSLCDTGVRGLDGMAALESVTGSVALDGNASLRDIDGLRGLTAVNGDLDMMRNAVLTNLDGLVGVAVVTGRVRIFDNPRLPACEARALADRVDVECNCAGNGPCR